MSDLVQRLRVDVLWHRRRGNETIAEDCQEAADTLEAKDAEIERLRMDAERYRALREVGALLKLYVYEDDGDPFSGDWKYKPSPEEVDAFADAMRCFVTSKLGDEVEIPEELIRENNN